MESPLLIIHATPNVLSQIRNESIILKMMQAKLSEKTIEDIKDRICKEHKDCIFFMRKKTK